MRKVLIVLMVILLLLLVSSCQRDDDSEVVNETTEENQSLEVLDIDLETEENVIKGFPDGELIEMKEKGQPLYEQLLADEAAGKITRNERALYTLIMGHKGEEDLPEAYQGYEGWVDPHYEIRYIMDEWDGLSKDEQELILPYILPINDPRSIYYVGPKEDSFSIVPKAYAASDALIERSFVHDGQTIEIAYVMKGAWLQHGDLNAIVTNLDVAVEEAIRHGWDKFKPLMQRKLSSKLRVEIVSMVNGLYGEEWFDGTQYRIRLNSLYANKPKFLQSTTVHELFHAFQEEYNIGYTKKEEKWLCEATAVWSENYVYSDYNFEHMRLPGFFKTLEKDRINFGNDFEYESYMLFYYLTDYADLNFIREAIEKAGTSGNAAIRPYLNSRIPNRKEVYSEFALYNWNKDPFIFYEDYGKLEGSPSGKGYYNTFMINETEDRRQVTLNPGGIVYYHYNFDRTDEDLHHVNIDFSNTFTSDEDIQRQALLKINGNWTIETWDDISKKRYCSLRNDEELLEELVLIYSNSSFTDIKNNIDHFKVWTEGCHEAMTFNISVTYEFLSDFFEWSLEGQLTEKLLIEEHYIYLVENSNYTFSGNGLLEKEYSVNTNGQISGSIHEPSVKNSLVRIILPMEEEHEETLEIYRTFGIEEITPQGGVLVTLPFAMNESNMSGSSTIELPEPVGTMHLDDPLPLDGISQAIAVKINPFDWGPEGISFSREIDLLAHKPAILNIYDFSPLKMKENLKMMQENYGGEGLDYNISEEELDEINKMLEDMPTVEGMDLPGLGTQNSLQMFNNLIGAMTLERTSSDVSATLTIKVKGTYIKD